LQSDENLATLNPKKIRNRHHNFNAWSHF